MTAKCELCETPGGEVIYRHAQFRVVLIDDANFPGFCRVIWHEHVTEMTDLRPEARMLVMQAVWCVEDAARAQCQPDKINLASLGNMTPHLHWHVIPRYRDDSHFPNPVWAAQMRTPDSSLLATRRNQLPALRAAIAANLAVFGPSE